MVNRVKSIIMFTMICLIAMLLVTPAHGSSDFIRDTKAIEKAANSVLKLEIYNKQGRKIATGSGFIVFDDVFLLTNYHVVEGGNSVIAISDDGAQYKVDYVLCSDKKMDIALLGFNDPTGIAPLPVFPSKSLLRGAEVIAIGSPIGLKNTVSSGIISSVYEEKGVPWIQITAPISHGSSGGAVFNNSGEVIGISSASYTQGQNLNLAINIGEALAMYQAWDGKTYTIDSAPRSAHFDYSGVYPSQEEAYLSSFDNLEWVCPQCGENNNTAYCIKCGTPRPLWECVCGEMNITAFCGNCGRSLEGINHIIGEIDSNLKSDNYEKAADLLSGLSKFNSMSVVTVAGDHYIASEKLQEVYEQWSEYLFSLKEYEQAVQIIDLMSDSKIKSDLSKKAYYLLGCELYDKADYEAAMTALQSADDYPGAKEKINECTTAVGSGKYAAAMELFNEGKYIDALAAFEELKEETDVTENIDECLYQAGISWLNQREIYKAAKLFIRIKDYKDVGEIIANDEELTVAMLNILFSADSEVIYGKYNGRKIKWVSCGLVNKKATLIAAAPVDRMSFNDHSIEVKRNDSVDINREIWKKSSLRKQLNETFYNKAFSKREKELIVPIEVRSGYALREKLLFYDKVSLYTWAQLDGLIISQFNKTNDSWTGWTVSGYKDTNGKEYWKAEYATGNQTHDISMSDYAAVKPVILVDISKMNYEDLISFWPDR